MNKSDYFKEKDRLFNERKASGEWPIKTCDRCLRKYYACKTCGHTTVFSQPVCPKCHGELKYVEHRFCCQRDYHHVMDNCVHCGNDERGYRTR